MYLFRLIKNKRELIYWEKTFFDHYFGIMII